MTTNSQHFFPGKICFLPFKYCSMRERC